MQIIRQKDNLPIKIYEMIIIIIKAIMIVESKMIFKMIMMIIVFNYIMTFFWRTIERCTELKTNRKIGNKLAEILSAVANQFDVDINCVRDCSASAGIL